LKNQFRFHTVGRRYVAIAHGDVTGGKITSRLVQDRGDGRRGSTDN
jgi:23S rRNA pseudouridine1911/1915/1917 synthase